MPRNKDRFEYIEVSIQKESELYQLLSADAKKTAQSLAQIMLVRLADYYEMVSGQPASFPPRSKPREKKETYHQETSALPEDKKAKTKKQPTQSKKESQLSPIWGDETDQEDDTPTYDFSNAMAGAALFDKL